MYRIHQIKLNIGESKDHIPEKIRKQTGAKVKDWRLVKESIDARDKENIKLVYTVDFSCDKKLKLAEAPDLSYHQMQPGMARMKHRPVIAGFGPCGMFAALILAQQGYRPVVLERGKPVEQRVKDVEAFWKEGVLDEESNVQFGEGGAGTFSDGKLTTGIKDPRIRKVLETFVAAGGDASLLYKQKPHIGTDLLRKIVVSIRTQILKLGGEIRFQSKVTDFRVQDGAVKAVKISTAHSGERRETEDTDKWLETENFILAVGHSARDTFRMLKEKGVPMEQKPFSMGVRIEHPQKWIDRAQYGNAELAKILGPAEYKLNYHCKSGRGVYTFCMCPGGHVIMAASQKDTVVTNGMSYHDRAGAYANSGLLVDVRTSDFLSEDVLAGVAFQEKYEHLAWQNGRPPQCTWGEFRQEGNSGCAVEDFQQKQLENKKKKANPVCASLPDFVVESIREAMPHLGAKLKGFDSPDARITGVESRSSSPVRILRNQNMESEITGLYPAGEGAGYAGGITSAAVDGIKIAEEIIRRYQPIE